MSVLPDVRRSDNLRAEGGQTDGVSWWRGETDLFGGDQGRWWRCERFEGAENRVEFGFAG